MDKVKVISLLQPYAQLVVEGHKKIETRSWKPSPETWQEIARLNGELYIHASKKINYAGLELCSTNEYFKKCIPEPGRMRTGAIIGKVTLHGFRSTNEQGVLHGISKQERAFGDYSENRWLWYLTNPIKFDKPIETKGALSVWEYEFPVPYMTIHFEDHGQDFLRWTVDGLGRVIDCQPFQGHVWIGLIVVNIKDLAKGDKVHYYHPSKPKELRTINYVVKGLSHIVNSPAHV